MRQETIQSQQIADGHSAAYVTKNDESVNPNKTNDTSVANDGPRIVINPRVFNDKRDAVCVAWNEALRIVMEDMSFDPVAEPTEEQRKFFSNTAYANDEQMLRRTILARICVFDTSVKNPTDEQIQEAIEFLEGVMQTGYPQNSEEQSILQRSHDILSKTSSGNTNEPQSEVQASEEPAQQQQEDLPAQDATQNVAEPETLEVGGLPPIEG